MRKAKLFKYAVVEPLDRKLRAFSKSCEAMAAIEFALILPFLLTLFFGIAEISSAFQIKKRMALIDLTLGDLVGRSGELNAAQIDDIFRAADLLIAPYSSAPLDVSVRAIRIDSTGQASILWARRSDGAAANVNVIPMVPAGLGTNRDLIEISTSYEFSFQLLFATANLFEFGQSSFIVPRTADLDSWNG